MTVADLIARAAPALAGLSGYLDGLAAQYPDLRPSLQPKIDALKAAADPLNLANVASASVSELVNLVSTGQIVPRSHPSDLVP